MKGFLFGMFVMNTILVVSLLSLGWFSNDLYQSYKDKSTIKGMWINGYVNEDRAEYLATEREPYGRWICINVVKEMSFEELTETCKHEAGHELFAKKCAVHPEFCFEVEKTMENTIK